MTMYYPPVEDPVPLPDAFASAGERASQSQAALLLLMGAAHELEAPVASVSEAADLLALDEDIEALRVPALALAAAAEKRLQSIDTLQRRPVAEPLRRALAAGPGEAVPAIGQIARRLSDTGDPDLAASLVAAAMAHPSPLVQVAAAAAAFSFFAGDDLAEPLRILETWALASDSFTRSLARAALGRYAPASAELRRLRRKMLPRIAGKASHTTLIVHGTFARQNSWWQFGGDFHTYLSAEVGLDVYSAADRYDWSGGYSDLARSRAGRELRDWVEARALAEVDLVCHSHGGNVAMLASAGGRVRKLVLMSCPAHEGKYDPDTSVADIVAFRVRMDLVILVDGGRQSFKNPRIRQHRLPIWFNHSATHEPQVWRDHNLPALL
jgi:hypothetical protein